MRRAGTVNPVFMLDEIDKLGSDYRGDPGSALLEVLDPEQNFSFRDHYLDVEFDLSRVLFICTANVLSGIPSALLDRMEVLELSGYSEEEKLAIAHRYLIPKQLGEHGLGPKAIGFTDDGVRTIINGYTHEAGLRNLEREIASVCRKIARHHAEGNRRRVKADAKRVRDLLGPAKYLRDELDKASIPGVANGLAWTPAGGEVLTIESVKSAAPKHELKLTGSLGEVMKESAHAAFGYLRAHAVDLSIDPSFFDRFEIHIHVPAGAIAKDGPSAGVALTASLLSLAKDRPLRPSLAMTGEITLTGRILPVGGIREKLLAARREKIETVILPFQNEKDTEELAKEIKDDLTLIFVRHMDEVAPHLFSDAPITKPRRTRAKIIKSRRETTVARQRPSAHQSP
jgi:ATP-dependent Lon protease